MDGEEPNKSSKSVDSQHDSKDSKSISKSSSTDLCESKEAQFVSPVNINVDYINPVASHSRDYQNVFESKSCETKAPDVSKNDADRTKSIKLTSFEVETNEENEIILFGHQAKLLRFEKNANEWKDYDIGNVQVLVNENNRNKIRLVMFDGRGETLKCNQFISKSVKFEKLPKMETALTWSDRNRPQIHTQTDSLAIQFKTINLYKTFYNAITEAQSNMIDVDIGEEKSKVQPLIDAFQQLNPCESSGSNISPIARIHPAKVFKSPTITRTLDSFDSGSSNESQNVQSTLSFDKVDDDSSTAEINESITSNTSENLTEFIPTAYFEPVVTLPIVETRTGEENEIVLFQQRAELFRFARDLEEWKYRGIGDMKVLVDKDDPNKVRLIMRRELVLKLCCNQYIHRNTKFEKMVKLKTVTVWCGHDFSENKMQTELLALRFETVNICNQFLGVITAAQCKMTDETIVAPTSVPESTENVHHKLVSKMNPIIAPSTTSTDKKKESYSGDQSVPKPDSNIQNPLRSNSGELPLSTSAAPKKLFSFGNVSFGSIPWKLKSKDRKKAITIKRKNSYTDRPVAVSTSASTTSSTSSTSVSTTLNKPTEKKPASSTERKKSFFSSVRKSIRAKPKSVLTLVTSTSAIYNAALAIPKITTPSTTPDLNNLSQEKHILSSFLPNICESEATSPILGATAMCMQYESYPISHSFPVEQNTFNFGSSSAASSNTFFDQLNYKEANVECASSDDDNEISEKEIYSTSRKIGISEHKIVDLENKFESDLTVALSRESSSDSRNSSPTFSSFKGNTFASPAQSVPASSNILEPGGSAVEQTTASPYTIASTHSTATISNSRESLAFPSTSTGEFKACTSIASSTSTINPVETSQSTSSVSLASNSSIFDNISPDMFYEKLFSERAQLCRSEIINHKYSSCGTAKFRILRETGTHKYRFSFRCPETKKQLLSMKVEKEFEMDLDEHQRNTFLWIGINHADVPIIGKLERLSLYFKNDDIATSFQRMVDICLQDIKDNDPDKKFRFPDRNSPVSLNCKSCDQEYAGALLYCRNCDSILFDYLTTLRMKENDIWIVKKLCRTAIVINEYDPNSCRLVIRCGLTSKVICNHSINREMEFAKLPHTKKTLAWCGPRTVSDQLQNEIMSIKFETVDLSDLFFDLIKSTQSNLTR